MALLGPFLLMEGKKFVTGAVNESLPQMTLTVWASIFKCSKYDLRSVGPWVAQVSPGTHMPCVENQKSWCVHLPGSFHLAALTLGLTWWSGATPGSWTGVPACVLGLVLRVLGGGVCTVP